MNYREVSKNEVIGIFLRREFDKNWSRMIEPTLRTCFPNLNLSKEYVQTIVEKPDFQNEEENGLRFCLLFYRRPLFPCIYMASWCERALRKNEFKDLKIINDQDGWRRLSGSTGDLSTVATLAYEVQVGKRQMPSGFEEMFSSIFGIIKGEIPDRNLILLISEDSTYTTILEGNKTAVALYIKYFLEKEVEYEPFKVYVGHLKSMSCWQW